MKANKFHELLTSVDVLNTLHGGVSEPIVSFQQQSTGREIHVRVPGVSKESLQVEINQDRISIFYLTPIESSGKLIQMPQVVIDKPIPYFIDISEIKATYTEEGLIVVLPYNKLSSGYNKRIEIGEE